MVGRPNAVQPQGAIRFGYLAMRAHPGGLAAAAGKVPRAADPVAARNSQRLVLVRWSPRHPGPWIAENRLRAFRRNKGGDQRGTVGDEQVPAHRTVVPADFLDRAQIGPRIHFIPADRPRQQDAGEPCIMDVRQQRFGNGLAMFDFIRGGDDFRPKITRAGNRIDASDGATDAGSTIGGAATDMVHGNDPCVIRARLPARHARIVNRHCFGHRTADRPSGNRETTPPDNPNHAQDGSLNGTAGSATNR